MKSKRIMDGEELERTISRLAHEILEKTGGGTGVALVGIRTRGVPLAQRLAVPVVVNQVGSMLTVFFSTSPVSQAAAVDASDRKRFAHWARALRAAGILVPPSPYEALFISAAHEPGHVERFLDAAERALTQIREGTR